MTADGGEAIYYSGDSGTQSRNEVAIIASANIFKIIHLVGCFVCK